MLLYTSEIVRTSSSPIPSGILISCKRLDPDAFPRPADPLPLAPPEDLRLLLLLLLRLLLLDDLIDGPSREEDEGNLLEPRMLDIVAFVGVRPINTSILPIYAHAHLDAA